jgi:hypothetical protein
VRERKREVDESIDHLEITLGKMRIRTNETMRKHKIT